MRHRVTRPQAPISKIYRYIDENGNWCVRNEKLWWYQCPYCVVQGRSHLGPHQERETRRLGEQHIGNKHPEVL